MIEIGKQKQKQVRRKDKKTGKLVPIFDDHDQPVTQIVSDEVWRVTRESLGGRFGPDGKRQLIVGFINGDLLVMRPKGTRQAVTMELKKIYGYALRCKAATALLEKANKARAKKQAARERREWKRRFK